MSHGFGADVMQKAQRRQRRWCQENLMTVLEQAKDRQARDIEVSIELAKKLLAVIKYLEFVNVSCDFVCRPDTGYII